MFLYVCMIFLSCFLFIWIVNKMDYPYGGSDHALYYKLSGFIRANHHRPVVDFEKNYQYFNLYPQLYCVLCSFMSDSFLLKRANIVNYIIIILMILFFGIFIHDILLDYYPNASFAFLLTLFLFILTPITYAIWNAKFMGLSARAFGLLSGHLFGYACFYYLMGLEWEYSALYQIGIYILLTCIVIVLLVGSMFAFQFYIFSSLFLSICTLHFEFLLPGVFAIGFQCITNFQLAKQFWAAQYNHKRNYSKYMVKAWQLASRPSIWRDFVYDFWIKKDKTYFLGNPVIEILLGASLNVFVFFFYLFFGDKYDSIQWNLFLVLAASFFAFFVTSLRFGRFLGEPQRYIEFGIPFACILACLLLPFWLLILFMLFDIFILLWYAKNSQYHRQLPEHIKIRGELLDFMREIYDDEYQNLLCNDSEILRHFYISRYKIFLPDHCIFYPKEEDFYAAFYNKDYHIISPDFLLNNLQEAQKGYIIFYTNLLKFYDETKILPRLTDIHLEHIRDIGKFKIFKFSKEHQCTSQF